MVRVDEELNFAAIPNDEPTLSAPYNEVRIVRPVNRYKIVFYIALATLTIACLVRQHSPNVTVNRAVPIMQEWHPPQPASQDTTPAPPQPAVDVAAALAAYQQIVAEEQNRTDDFLDGLQRSPAEEPECNPPGQETRPWTPKTPNVSLASIPYPQDAHTDP